MVSQHKKNIEEQTLLPIYLLFPNFLSNYLHILFIIFMYYLLLNPATGGVQPAHPWCRSQVQINGEGWRQEGHPAVKTPRQSVHGADPNEPRPC